MFFKHSQNEKITPEKWQTELLEFQDIDLYKKHANKVDDEGNNFTHYAAYTGNVDLVQQLKEWNESLFAKSIREGGNIVIWAIGSKNKNMLKFFYQYEKSLFDDNPIFIDALAVDSWAEGVKWFGRHTPKLFIDKWNEPSRLEQILTFIKVDMLDWFVIDAINVIKQLNVPFDTPILLIKAFKLARIDVLRWVEQNEYHLRLLHIARNKSNILYKNAWSSGSLDVIKFLHYYFGNTSLVFDASEWIGHALNTGNPAIVNYALSFFPVNSKITIDDILDLRSEEKIAARAGTLNKLLDCNFTLTHFSTKYYGKRTLQPEITKKLDCNKEWPKNYAINMKKALIFFAGFAPSHAKDMLIHTACLLLLMSVPHPEVFCWKGFFNHKERFLLPEQQKPREFSAFNYDFDPNSQP